MPSWFARRGPSHALYMNIRQRDVRRYRPLSIRKNEKEANAVLYTVQRLCLVFDSHTTGEGEVRSFW